VAVEIQEPTLRALVLAYSWPLAPRFPDVRGAATEILREATGSPDDWSWDPSSSGAMVFAWHEKRRLHLILSGAGLDIVSDGPEDPEPVAESVLARCAELLNVSELDECIASAMWLLAAPNVDDASAGIERAFGAEKLRQLLEPLGGRPSRLEIEAVFEDEYGSAMLRAKPASAEELVNDAEYFLSDVESSELPPAAIAVRIKRRRSAGEVAEAVGRSRRLLESVLEAGDKLLPKLVTP
jgi:hypothetical protein